MQPLLLGPQHRRQPSHLVSAAILFKKIETGPLLGLLASPRNAWKVSEVDYVEKLLQFWKGHVFYSPRNKLKFGLYLHTHFCQGLRSFYRIKHSPKKKMERWMDRQIV